MERGGGYTELVRLGERSIDDQSRKMQEHLSLARDVGRLGISLLAGVLAVVALLLEGGVPIGWVGFGGSATTIVLTMIGLLVLLSSASGGRSPRRFRHGPRLAALLARYEENAMRDEELAGTVAQVLAANEARNEVVLEDALRLRNRAAKTIVWAALVFTASLGYIAGRAILG